jgi:hypothetical protein
MGGCAVIIFVAVKSYLATLKFIFRIQDMYICGLKIKYKHKKSLNVLFDIKVLHWMRNEGLEGNEEEREWREEVDTYTSMAINMKLLLSQFAWSSRGHFTHITILLRRAKVFTRIEVVPRMRVRDIIGRIEASTLFLGAQSWTFRGKSLKRIRKVFSVETSPSIVALIRKMTDMNASWFVIWGSRHELLEDSEMIADRSDDYNIDPLLIVAIFSVYLWITSFNCSQCWLRGPQVIAKWIDNMLQSSTSSRKRCSIPLSYADEMVGVVLLWYLSPFCHSN